MNKWQQWHDNLPTHTKQYLKNQAIWRDQDLAKFALLAFLAGIIVGKLV